MLRGCLGFLQTSTYQAVLTTDGNRSFALLLYQDGGMRWDYAKLAAGNVLIGFSRCCAPVWLRFGTAGISPSTMLGPPETLSPGEPTPRVTLSRLNPLSCKLQQFPPQLLYGEWRRVVLGGWPQTSSLHTAAMAMPKITS